MAIVDGFHYWLLSQFFRLNGSGLSYAAPKFSSLSTRWYAGSVRNSMNLRRPHQLPHQVCGFLISRKAYRVHCSFLLFKFGRDQAVNQG